jgi:hypothetical protein
MIMQDIVRELRRPIGAASGRPTLSSWIFE